MIETLLATDCAIHAAPWLGSAWGAIKLQQRQIHAREMDMFKLSLTPSLVAKNLPARDNRKAPTPLFGQDRISEWWMQFFDIKRCIHMFSTHWQVWVLLQSIRKFWSWGVLIKLAACFYSYITIGKIEQHGLTLICRPKSDQSIKPHLCTQMMFWANMFFINSHSVTFTIEFLSCLN